MKRVAFTGGSGKAGRHVIPYLLNCGYNVLNLDLVPLDANGVNNLIVDITDSGQVFNSLTSYLNIDELKESPGSNKFDALVKLRNTARPVQVKIQTDLKKSSASVILKNPEFGISPGQAAVFYDLEDKNRVLGGGWIKSTKNYLND